VLNGSNRTKTTLLLHLWLWDLLLIGRVGHLTIFLFFGFSISGCS